MLTRTGLIASLKLSLAAMYKASIPLAYWGVVFPSKVIVHKFFLCLINSRRVAARMTGFYQKARSGLCSIILPFSALSALEGVSMNTCNSCTAFTSLGRTSLKCFSGTLSIINDDSLSLSYSKLCWDVFERAFTERYRGAVAQQALKTKLNHVPTLRAFS